MLQRTFEAADRPVKEVFSPKYLFTMPSYQRPYAWTNDEAGELLSDLTNALPTNDEGDRAKPYFLGSIVLTEQHGAPGYQVIDGQQRLTTLTILFCTIRELSQSEDFKQDMNKFIREESNVVIGTKGRFLLSLRERDAEFFQEKVQIPGRLQEFINGSVPKFDSQRLVHDNAKYFWGKLNKWSEDRRERLARFIVHSCYFVVVEVVDRAAAHRVFFCPEC